MIKVIVMIGDDQDFLNGIVRGLVSHFSDCIITYTLSPEEKEEFVETVIVQLSSPSKIIVLVNLHQENQLRPYLYNTVRNRWADLAEARVKQAVFINEGALPENTIEKLGSKKSTKTIYAKIDLNKIWGICQESRNLY
jgi:hypothetical protein